MSEEEPFTILSLSGHGRWGDGHRHQSPAGQILPALVQAAWPMGGEA